MYFSPVYSCIIKYIFSLKAKKIKNTSLVNLNKILMHVSLSVLTIIVTYTVPITPGLNDGKQIHDQSYKIFFLKVIFDF